MIGSGIRSKPEATKAMAISSNFTFNGSLFMLAVSALGKEGGDYTNYFLKNISNNLQSNCVLKIQAIF
jgi:hypothetical protein